MYFETILTRKKRSKVYDVSFNFSRDFFVLMRDTSIGYDENINAFLLAIKRKQTLHEKRQQGDAYYYIIVHRKFVNWL